MRRVKATLCALALLIASTLSAQENPPAETAPPPPPPPPKYWTSSIGAGLALTSGNTDTKNINFSFNTVYDPKTRNLFKAEALFLRGESDGETQVDRLTAGVRGEHTFSDGNFAFAEISYVRDPFKDINYSVAPVIGAGRRLIWTDVHKFSIDGAVGLRAESNDADGRSTESAVLAGESYEWTLSPTSRFTQKATGLWTVDDFGDAVYHLEAGLITSVRSRIELKIAANHDYRTRPPAANIKKSDSALFAALLFKF